ncbi:uncharacterized protein TEOVI_000742500 [Trypanosoma equiperdum]|uniref:Feruloyl esterase n=2 Tax=Trypanozoon TaxID=39700 RepID=Q389X6_TRYB2|nr:hypothetical protein, conserved [Trypanosoma brucei brucei TREU927]EAN78394.1 hypothetical protein, conserved [Trypanosoma brucei brucei TREU927]SCU67998.1 hypothetical protein, conserved [Trypanosoma equiperdum]
MQRCTPVLLLLLCSLLTLPNDTVARPKMSRRELRRYLPREPPAEPSFHHLRSVVLLQRTGSEKDSVSECNGETPFPTGEPVLVNTTLADGTKRRFVIYVPSSYAERKEKVSLKLLFHGLAGDCATFLNTTGFIPHAEKDGYILASACGTSSLMGAGWNAGECCLFFNGAAPNDTEFAKHIIDVVSSKACVDRNKIMSVGYSNGAMLSELLACQNPPIVRAVASVAGTLAMSPGGEGGIAACAKMLRGGESGCRTSILKINGMRDGYVPFRGSSFLNLPAISENVKGWVSANGCRGRGVTTISNSKFRNKVYNDCSSENGVLYRFWCFIHRLAHFPTGLGSKKSTDVNTSDANEKDATGEDAPATETCKKTVVESVYALEGTHEWPNKENFSATAYIYEFGKRVLGSY